MGSTWLSSPPSLRKAIGWTSWGTTLLGKLAILKGNVCSALKIWRCERANTVNFHNLEFMSNISNLFQINCRWNEGFYTNFLLWWIRDQKDAFAQHHHFIITANVKDNLPFNATFLELLQLIFCQKEMKLRTCVKMWKKNGLHTTAFPWLIFLWLYNTSKHHISVWSVNSEIATTNNPVWKNHLIHKE